MHGEGEIQCGEGIWMGKSYKFNGCGMLNATWGRDLDGEILQITSMWDSAGSVTVCRLRP